MKHLTNLPVVALAAALACAAGASAQAPRQAAAAEPSEAPAAPAQAAPPSWKADRSASLPERPEAIQFPALEFSPPRARDFRRTLPDGTPVYLAPSKEFPLVNLTMTFKGGAFTDPKDIPGLTAAMAAMVRTGGTASAKPADVDEKLDFLATNVKVDAAPGGAIVASMNTLKSNLDESMAVFFDMLRNPGFDQARLDVLRGQATEAMKQRNDDAAAILGREWRYLVYGDDHFESQQQTKAGWDALDAGRLRAQHARLMHPGNVIIAVTGDFDPDEMMRKLASAMEGWARGDMAPNPPAPTHALQPGVYRVSKDIPQGKVRVGRRAIQRDDPDFYAVEVMNEILGAGGFTSRLVKSIRSNEGLAYSVGSRLEPGVWYPGQLACAFESKNATVALAIRLMRDEFRRLQDEPVSPEELQVAKRSFVESFPTQFASKDATLGILVADEWTGRDPEYWQNFRENIGKVTAEDVQRVARKYLNFDDMAVLVVGRWEEIAPGDKGGRASMAEFFGGASTPLPLRDPMTMRPMEPAATPAPQAGAR